MAKGRRQVARLENQQLDHRMTGKWFRRLVDHSPDGICVVKDGHLVYVNATAMRWFAAETSDQLVGHHITDFVDDGAVPPTWVGAEGLRELGDTLGPCEARMLRVDGTKLRLEAAAVLTLWEGALACQVVFREVNARGAGQLASVLESLDDGVVVVRNDGSIRFINPAAMRIYGLGPEHDIDDFATHAASLRFYDADGEPVPCAQLPATRTFRTGDAYSRQVYGTDLPNGERRWLLTNCRLLEPHAPANSDVLISFSDITTERAATEELVRQANHDPLTGLPNRAFVLRRITEALASTGRGRLRAVLFIDLDDLKTTNDTLGHEAGDDLLGAAATRLRQAVGPSDVVGRHGGDEFVVLLFSGSTRRKLGAVVKRLRQRLAEPVVIAGTATPIHASVGVVEVERGDQRTAEDILRDADRAMYKAKRAGRNNCGHARAE
jgi:diguanylate cyclase (GGDEF)-like protein